MGKQEIVELPTSAANLGATLAHQQSKKRVWQRTAFFSLFAVLALLAFSPVSLPGSLSFSPGPGPIADGQVEVEMARNGGHCVQVEPLLPKSVDVQAAVAGKDSQIIEWLSGAVRVPTEIFDEMGEIGEDKRWDVFYKFSEYLEKAFPLTHEHLNRTRVMTHALVFEWQGSDPFLKPILLTGHQDVVPVLPATRGLWTHDPYGGEYDGESIWGRGSSDDKSGTIGILSAIELLLESGKFTPTRSVVLAFGIDEESGGKVGALNLNVWLEEKYGQDSMAILVDEGAGIQQVWGSLWATPAVGEKGYLDAEIRVETKGGHSSIPPKHTGIGLIALLIAALEETPYEPYLNPTSPLIGYLSCAANSAPGMPTELRKATRKVVDSLSSRNRKVDKKALRKLQDWFVTGSVEDKSLPEGNGRALVTTTQAIDIINGGVKVNALPEVVTAVVNHRISVASDYPDVQQHMIDTLTPVLKKYNLGLEAFGANVTVESECNMLAAQPKAGKVILSQLYGSALSPAPISPYTIDSPAWRILSGTIKGVYNTRPEAGLDAEEANKLINTAPSIMTGNTDTKRYWGLTKNIYRFAYQGWKRNKGLAGVHTVDEHMDAEEFIEEVRWFMTFIVNMDETRDL